MTPDEDWSRARRAAKGDMDAFAALVNRYQRPVIQFCYRMTGSMVDAEDIAQETFVNLYRSLDRLRQESAFSTVVFCYARNATLNHLRNTGRRRRWLDAFRRENDASAAGWERPDRRAQAKDIATMLDAGIAALAPEFREVFILREFEGLDYQRIAGIAGCPVGTVRSRLARAREQLREYLARTCGDGAL
ncbi:MAG: sigma-70 family RNA polymerase sigma factor [Candidatus Hydrogenedentes bacterium]|nr:sigma-70 family RNA polymerase sigma factor [Candidatus Hydrogenedentota bacterium]